LRERVAAKLPDEGFLSREGDVSAEPTPHPNEFVADAGVALSRKGRGRSNGRRRERVVNYLLPLWEKVAAKLPDEGSLSTDTKVSAEPTPHPNEFVADAGAALSRKGRGRSNRHR
jgi:hypothetical protein